MQAYIECETHGVTLMIGLEVMIINDHVDFFHCCFVMLLLLCHFLPQHITSHHTLCCIVDLCNRSSYLYKIEQAQPLR
jgi:hypothetical protein